MMHREIMDGRSIPTTTEATTMCPQPVHRHEQGEAMSRRGADDGKEEDGPHALVVFTRKFK